MASLDSYRDSWGNTFLFTITLLLGQEGAHTLSNQTDVELYMLARKSLSNQITSLVQLAQADPILNVNVLLFETLHVGSIVESEMLPTVKTLLHKLHGLKYRRLSWHNNIVVIKHVHDKLVELEHILLVAFILFRKFVVDVGQKPV